MASNDPNPNPNSISYPFLNPNPGSHLPGLLCNPNPSSHFPGLLCNPNPLQHNNRITDQILTPQNPNNYHPQSPHPSFISSSSSADASSSAASAAAASVDINAADHPIGINSHMSENLYSALSFDLPMSWSDGDPVWPQYYGALGTDEAMSEQCMHDYANASLLLCPSNCLFTCDCAATNPTSLSVNDPAMTVLDTKPGVTFGGNSSTSEQLIDFDDQVVCIRLLSMDLRCNDGYFWRKYGEKNIKNRKFRRSYFKCADSGCKVAKRAERCSDDPENFVIITYKGKHNHPGQHL